MFASAGVAASYWQRSWECFINNMVMKQEKYICNGKTFSSYHEVIEYCKLNNFRVANTNTISKGIYLITVNSL